MVPSRAQVPTLVDMLVYRSKETPEKTASTFLIEGEDDRQSYTYAAWDARARAIAVRLRQSHAKGDRALLLYPSGLDYIAAFMGCLYAGVIAVPAYPPRKNRSLDRIDAIVSDSGATVVLTHRSIANQIQSGFADQPELQALSWIATDEPLGVAGDAWENPSLGAEDLAFLQYTSGSTGRPKGVMVTHGNLMANEAMISAGFGNDETTPIVGWLPLYHDMGLIGNMLNALYCGSESVFMAPVAFLQQPIRWLRAIQATKGGIVAGGPNFAFDLCVRKVTDEQMQGLDLSGWRVAYSGAEPVRAHTLKAFAEKFASVGFDPKAFYPCFGLAEATLFVSGGASSTGAHIESFSARGLANDVGAAPEDDADVSELVSCGRPWAGGAVRICAPDSLDALPEGQIGEIIVAGDHVAAGYWGRPEETAATFPTDETLGRAMRTGDLGVLREGNLYVTGRMKDLIIIRGRNHYPQDIEHTVEEAHPSLRKGACAAFALEVDGEERLGVVIEVERTALRDLDDEAVGDAVRSAVSTQHEIQVHTLVFIKPGAIPKTTSGKIQRSTARKEFLDGRLPVVGTVVSTVAESDDVTADEAPANVQLLDPAVLATLSPDEQRTLIQLRLQYLVARAQKIPMASVARDVTLASLGLDSLDVVEIKGEIEQALSITLPADENLVDATIRELADRAIASFNPTASANAGDGSSGTPVPAPVDEADFDLFAKATKDGGYFGKYRLKRDRYSIQPCLEGVPGPDMSFQGQKMVVWSINNYLGLVEHPHIKEATQKALAAYGTWSPMGSRMLTGNTHAHIALEERLAAYCQKENSVVFNYGYMGVMGTIQSITGPNDTVIIDSLSHACIVDGAFVAAAGKPFRVFRHNDLESLEEQLIAANRNRRGGILIVTEGVFGMSGDTAPLKEICDLKDKYNARLFVDDAHGFGIMGPTGAGTAEHLGVQDRVDLYFGTFAKSFVGIGGVTAGPDDAIEYIRFNARTNIFAKSLPMVYVAAIDAALDVMLQEPERRDVVWGVARKLRQGLIDLGFNTGATESPITPVYIPAGNEETATTAMRILREEHGIFVSAVTYPVVPKGIVLFRMTATADHTDEHIQRTLDAFEVLRDRLHLRPANESEVVREEGDLIAPTADI